MTDVFRPRKFSGTEIAREIVAAIEALPRDAEIVTMSAGENMPITCAYVVGEYDNVIPEYVWTGMAWVEIGAL